MSRLSSLFRMFRSEQKHLVTSLDELRQCKGVLLAKGIHVGAHNGQERDLYESMGFGSMLWVEASPEQFAKLEARLGEAAGRKMQSVAVNAFASETDGESVHLRRFNNSGASSSVFAATQLLRETWPGLDETGTSEEVQTATLDRIASETGFADADFLNVDVQGAELLVLKGATSVLSRVKAVIAEVSTQPFYEGGVLWPELRDYLRTHGFEPTTENPNPHGDVLFLRK